MKALSILMFLPSLVFAQAPNPFNPISPPGDPTPAERRVASDPFSDDEFHEKLQALNDFEVMARQGGGPLHFSLPEHYLELGQIADSRAEQAMLEGNQEISIHYTVHSIEIRMAERERAEEARKSLNSQGFDMFCLDATCWIKEKLRIQSKERLEEKKNWVKSKYPNFEHWVSHYRIVEEDFIAGMKGSASRLAKCGKAKEAQSVLNVLKYSVGKKAAGLEKTPSTRRPRNRRKNSHQAQNPPIRPERHHSWQGPGAAYP
jgi:hypothetical protein